MSDYKHTIEEGKMKKVNGLTAYDILRIPGCPIKLPKARSMTQAKIDYEHLEDGIFQWYNSTQSK